MTPALRIRGLTIRLGEAKVLDGLDLEVRSGETLALLGPSGSGKTTLMYAVAGLVAPEEGSIEIGGRAIAPEIGPEHRSVGMVFQNYALWPHLTALETVAYPYRRRGVPAAEARAEARRLLALVGIEELTDRLPDQMSGGQQQRVGLARALAIEPSIYLFDEPTAHLDAAVREALQEELMRQRAATGVAAVYTTHDAGEAMAVADRVAVLGEGRIVQVAAPEEVYARPADVWTARLTGPVSVVSGELGEASGGLLRLTIAGEEIEVAGEAAVPSGPVDLVVRPDWASLEGPLSGVVTAVRYDGPHTDLVVSTAAGEVRVRRPGPPSAAEGSSITVSLDRGWALPQRDEP